jgi:hypothetical protein
MDDDWREPLTIATRLDLACFVGPRLWASAVMRLSWFLKASANSSPTSRKLGLRIYQEEPGRRSRVPSGRSREESLRHSMASASPSRSA